MISAMVFTVTTVVYLCCNQGRKNKIKITSDPVYSNQKDENDTTNSLVDLGQ